MRTLLASSSPQPRLVLSAQTSTLCFALLVLSKGDLTLSTVDPATLEGPGPSAVGARSPRSDRVGRRPRRLHLELWRRLLQHDYAGRSRRAEASHADRSRGAAWPARAGVRRRQAVVHGRRREGDRTLRSRHEAGRPGPRDRAEPNPHALRVPGSEPDRDVQHQLRVDDDHRAHRGPRPRARWSAAGGPPPAVQHLGAASAGGRGPAGPRPTGTRPSWPLDEERRASTSRPMGTRSGQPMRKTARSRSSTSRPRRSPRR